LKFEKMFSNWIGVSIKNKNKKRIKIELKVPSEIKNWRTLVITYKIWRSK